MRIILLLLVALAGPFCTFTQASTLVVPTAFDLTLVQGTVSEAPDVIATTEKIAPQEAASTPAPVPVATEAAATTEAPSLTEEAPSSSSTETPVIGLDDQIKTAAPTDAPKLEEAGPEEMATTEALTEDKEPTTQPEKVEEIGSESPTNVKIDGEEDTGTGQLVGIVIGALIGVIVVIAVIILVVRRMGQYSP
ncbi:threonine-rich protein isoform X2 [Chanodichthys erythropterus]|uniref:threonine-rich protein isoform X2 n=1 Tax=Chanodichthys erythropterus TaxID=933992 RepID=UPI00351E0D05